MLQTHSASAASFDCKKASSSTEKTICSDQELSILDSKLAEVYHIAMQNQSINDKIKLEQREWVKHTKSCMDTECLKKLYKTRINEISSNNISGKTTDTQRKDNEIKPEVQQNDTANEHKDVNWDVAGIAIGDSLDKAIETIKKDYPDAVVDIAKMNVVNVPSDVSYGADAKAAKGQDSVEYIVGTDFRNPFKTLVVYKLLRYSNSEKNIAPTVEVMKKALVDKYGQPSATNTSKDGNVTKLYWLKGVPNEYRDPNHFSYDNLLVGVLSILGAKYGERTNDFYYKNMTGTILLATIIADGPIVDKVYYALIDSTQIKQVRSDWYKMLDDGANAAKQSKIEQGSQVKPSL